MTKWILMILPACALACSPAPTDADRELSDYDLFASSADDDSDSDSDSDDDITGPFGDKGKIKFKQEHWNLNLQIASEIAIREPSMCDGEVEGEVEWDKTKNKLVVRAEFEGLPYRPSYCYDDFLGNPSTPYNPMPDCVEDGRWQMWLIFRWATITSTWYYDATTKDILGNEFEFAEGGRFGPDALPADAIPLTVPSFQLACTPTFDPDPDSLEAEVEFEFDYDQILDDRGTGGTLSTIIPQNLDDPDSIALTVVVGGIAPEHAVNFDDVLADLESGEGAISLYTSLEPEVKPDFLLSRDNSMIGWATVRPPDKIVEIEPPSECGTYQLDNYFGFIP